MSGKFLFGAATSAHQVEGNNVHNDWWAWEQTLPVNMRSGRAVDHYGLFKEDFLLAQKLGHNAHRLSLEWSRLEPERGIWNRSSIEHYRQVLSELHRLGMKSFVTLHHFTNPLWFAESGGWASSAAPRLFARYTKMVVEQLGDLVDFWITINEPMVYATQAFWRRWWPPGAEPRASLALTGRATKRALDTLRVIKHMAQAHRAAYRVIHQLRPAARVGLAKHLIAYVPARRGWLPDKMVAGLQDRWFNHRFFSLTGRTHDFIGVNYYFTSEPKVTILPPALTEKDWNGPRSDLGWAIRPEGLTQVLLHMRRYHLPIFVTENGLADESDSRRPEFIRAHLRAIEKAQAQGADVRGYLHWSLLDNFEWDLGFKRFGLIEVDEKTMKRTPRPSAHVYKAIIEQAS